MKVKIADRLVKCLHVIRCVHPTVCPATNLVHSHDKATAHKGARDTNTATNAIIISCAGSFGDDEAILKWTKEGTTVG